MKLLRSLLLFVLSLGVAHAAEPAAAPASTPASSSIVWHKWTPDIFAQAKREHKFVLLDLEAVWCHWCHVMDETTYRDADVASLIAANYLCVRVDQDSRPDLANRYEDYGWPATIFFGPEGQEIVKKQGYITPAGMVRLLKAIVEDPSPVDYGDAPAAVSTGESAMSAAQRTTLHQRWLAAYDDAHGGWGGEHKFVDWDMAELALREATTDERVARMARDTLRLQREHLLDPVWGGIYQYSVGGDWKEPHFEKLLQFQAENIRLYALASAQWPDDPALLATARAIRGYVAQFLTSPEGAFYVSQDADLVPGEHSAEYYALDDAGRRARGIPRVDRHLYARENGWMIAALCQLAAVTADRSEKADTLAAAERAARWVLAHRALSNGGFSHDEHDTAGPFLGDTLAMGRAFLALHEATQSPEWLERASTAAAFIHTHFARADAPGFASSDTTLNAFPAPRPQFDENVSLARFAIALAATTGRAEHRVLATDALRWLTAPEISSRRGPFVAGLLLAEQETRTEPAHITIVGAKDSPVAQALFAIALRLPSAHRLIEWWDPQSGPPPRGEAIYPAMQKPAAFLCANGACSSPLLTPEALAARLARLK